MYDVAVVGVGGMGSAAVYELARRGAKVIGLEQFEIPHDRGSSHGETRIIRLAYAEGPAYVPLLRRAYELWRRLEQVADERLLFITGGIDAGRAESATVTGALRSCAAHDLDHDVLTAGQLHERFPGFRFPDGMVAVHQPDGGFVLPERSIISYVVAARRLGAEVCVGEAVRTWDVQNGAVSVTTTRGTYRARKLVVTAGAWAQHLLPLLRGAASPERQVMIWTQPLRPKHYLLGAFPIFNMEAPEGRFYGFPTYGVPGFKLGKYHHRRERVDPDQVDRTCHAEDEEVLRTGIATYFPDANGPTLDMKVCLFTNSPDEHFIIDLHPDHPEVVIAAGFSGHGFKFCSVVGEVLAHLALDGASTHDIELFRVSRLTER